jgi:hypothetical protein
MLPLFRHPRLKPLKMTWPQLDGTLNPAHPSSRAPQVRSLSEPSAFLALPLVLKGSRQRRDDEQEQDGQLKPLSSLPVGAPPTPRRVDEQRVDTHSSAACRRIAWNGRQRGSLHFALQQLKTNTEKETNPRKTSFSSNLLSFLF